MGKMRFAEAIDDALTEAMAHDSRIILFGEDVQTIRLNLFTRFGKERVRSTPISEGAFVGAAVTAAMAGLRPIVEVMLVDFVGPAMDALLNHAAKVEVFSGGEFNVPMVVRTACGGGYGDGGQHEQSLWGLFSHIPGLHVVVPSTPSDAGGLMLSALLHEGPVIFLEHKLLAENWLEFMGRGGRSTVEFDVPAEGAEGPVPLRWEPIPLGKGILRREGKDLTLISVGVGVHRSLEAADILEEHSVSAGVIDLRSVSPLDRTLICDTSSSTGHVIVVDEDYERFGLSGEVAAVILETGISVRYDRVCTKQTIPYFRQEEDRVLPSTQHIVEVGLKLVQNS